jgi:hypothetical protein
MDISGLLKSLNAQHVRYVVIGASAFPTRGYVRTTADIDILENLIEMKRAANRPKDRQDLTALREIKRRKRKLK